ncbi:MAG: hypothetical protein OEW62_09315 [Candidatus Bathyarchaeota archaeon]|nr:hypothetical protein [Candidatus Bathyarchaeota archaeon]MDH5596339.1 hypothetical protein [Candidatus Bathyarchaeota archaeon]
MSTEDRKTRILNAIQKFNEGVKEYISIESQIDRNRKAVQSKKEELSEVAHKERIRELAEEVLFPAEQKGPSQSRKVEEEVRVLETEISSLKDELNKIKIRLTQRMYNLPIPIDLDKYKKEEGKTIFSFFDEAELGEIVINIMCKLLKMEKLEFQGVKILSDKVVVESSSRDEGIVKLASGIKAYRLKLGEILNVYEQIDVMVERAIKSDLYPRILRMLLIEKKMSSEEIAKKLGENERKVYDACYNLTRDQWTPAPLKHTNSREWTLTISGEILANRLLEKYPEKAELETARVSSTS